MWPAVVQGENKENGTTMYNDQQAAQVRCACTTLNSPLETNKETEVVLKQYRVGFLDFTQSVETAGCKLAL